MGTATAVLALLTEVSVVSANEPAFTVKPAAARDGERVRISFAVSGPTDVEVAVLDVGERGCPALCRGHAGRERGGAARVWR